MDKLPTFWNKLFCKHDYEEVGQLSVYSSTEDQQANLPTRTYRRFLCKKCGKIRKFEI